MQRLEGGGGALYWASLAKLLFRQPPHVALHRFGKEKFVQNW